jgi:hypothetical protein
VCVCVYISKYTLLPTRLLILMLVKLPCHYCKYFRLPEDEHTVSKHVDVIKIKSKNINLENLHFVGL